MGIVAAINAGDYIELDERLGHQQVVCLTGALETLWVAAHPVMVVGQSVDAEGHGVEMGVEEAPEPLGGEQESVGDHAPCEAAFMESASTFLQVVAHQRFAAGNDDENLRGIGVGSNVVEHTEEVFARHVGSRHHLATIAPAMAAMHVAAQRTLPEQLSEWVAIDDVAPDDAFHLECHTLFQLQMVVHFSNVEWRMENEEL